MTLKCEPLTCAYPAEIACYEGSESAVVVRIGSAEQSKFHLEDDRLAREVAVALEFNGISHATLLATPTDLEDFALGFSLTEGIIHSANDLYDIELSERPEGIVIQAQIASACLHELKMRRRNLAGRTGCGLCGVESLGEVRRVLPAVQARHEWVSTPAILDAVAQLRAQQPLHQETGATHAAGWASLDGQLLFVREDVGRHNALDKLIGHLLREAIDPASGFAVISSRASFEMVQKAAAMGMSALIAVSAPTTYACALANDLNVMLAGFARGNAFTVYSHPEFLISHGSTT